MGHAGDATAQPKTRPPGQVTVVNAASLMLAGLEVATTTNESKVVGRLSEGLAPGKTIKLRLKGQVGCEYRVRAEFEDGTASEAQTVNLCEDQVLRFTDGS